MFEDSLFESGGRIRPRCGLAIATSLALQSLLLATLVLLPLFWSEGLPGHLQILRGPVMSSPPPLSESPETHVARTSASEIRYGHLLPRHIPSTIAHVVEEQEPSAGLIIGMHYGTGVGATDGPLHGILSPETVVPPSPPRSPTRRVRVSQGVVEGRLIRQVKPMYPSLAVQTHTQAIVVLHATIGRDGAILSLQLVSGHPLLAPAAIDAVRQWRYRPYTLNGEPAEVETMVTVRFVLGN